ncbi:RNA 2'-phosphotransferase [Chitinophaga sp.]|uniref:RNA 2'-phosphotransferase n=1 Tax=Chitinophaga sp. TaxID=1869181 RepID=UPI0025BCA0B4|nr:RNA 2'-phosphotransferase [Chitinophaga sp.]
MNLKSISKFLSLVLRHSPETIELTLDDHGWADVATLLQQCKIHGRPFTFAELEIVVAENDKQRFASMKIKPASVLTRDIPSK